MAKLVLIFVDCEAWGNCPATGQLTEFGAVEYASKETFHGVLVNTTPNPANPAVPLPTPQLTAEQMLPVFQDFDKWLKKFVDEKGTVAVPKFVSDNPAFDWQWINDGFWRTLDRNPFGHSARRIGDYYAGLMHNFYAKQEWKRMRVTKHDHNPVHDALGNVEAFEKLQMLAKRLQIR